jgi:hypothetical protein
VLKDFFKILNEIYIFLVLWLSFINNFFDFLFDRFFSMLNSIFLQIMIIMIINTFNAEEFSILHAKVFQFSSFMKLTCEQLSLYSSFGFFFDLVVICLDLVICIQNLEIKLIRCLALMTNM